MKFACYMLQTTLLVSKVSLLLVNNIQNSFRVLFLACLTFTCLFWGVSLLLIPNFFVFLRKWSAIYYKWPNSSVLYIACLLHMPASLTCLPNSPYFPSSGFPSWIIWRSAYLTRLGSWRLRMQVPMDWLKSFLYGRDTSKFE